MDKKGKRNIEDESSRLVFKWLSDFDPKVVKGLVLDENLEYLDKTIERLEGLMIKSAGESKIAPTARVRAIARDTEKSTAGLINGIKYAVSFLTLGNKENFNEDSDSERQDIQ